MLWTKAVEKAGALDADKVVAVLNTDHDEPTVLGPRSFSPKLHTQDQSPLFVVSINNRPGKVVDTWRISEAIPNDVLYRLKK